MDSLRECKYDRITMYRPFAILQAVFFIRAVKKEGDGTMPCPHYRIKISTRRKGHSAVAQAAYQSGDRLFDERENKTKYYSEKRDIVYTEILLPVNAPREYADRNSLWNAVEAAENNWNSQLARRFEIALPIELPMEERVALIRQHCMEQFVSKGMIADIAVHDPDPPGHNPHAHVMLTMRPMDENGKWMEKAHREYLLDENGERVRDAKGKFVFRKVPTVDWNDRGNAERWRSAWEDLQNRYLEAAGRPERISMKSYQRQGIDRIPTVHMGPAVTAMERRGIMTNMGNLNRDIKSANKLMDVLKRTIARLISWIAEIRQAIKELDMQPKEIPLVTLLEQSFEESITDRRGQKRTTQGEHERFTAVTGYMREHDVMTVEDLDNRLNELNASGLPVKEQMKQLSGRIKTIEKLIEHGDRRASLDAIHDEYLKLHWKGRKEKFAQQHKDELDAWKSSDRYLRKNLPEQEYNGTALKNELNSLKLQLDGLYDKLRPQNEELELLKDVRTYVKRLLPELEPDGEALTPERRKEKIEAIQQRLAKAKAEAEANAAAYAKSKEAAARDEKEGR